MHTYVWGLNITSYTETKRCGSEVASDASCVYLAVSLPNVLYSKSWWFRASPNKVKRCSSCVYVHVTTVFLCMYASTSNYVLILQKQAYLRWFTPKITVSLYCIYYLNTIMVLIYVLTILFRLSFNVMSIHI